MRLRRQLPPGGHIRTFLVRKFLALLYEHANVPASVTRSPWKSSFEWRQHGDHIWAVLCYVNGDTGFKHRNNELPAHDVDIRLILAL